MPEGVQPRIVSCSNGHPNRAPIGDLAGYRCGTCGAPLVGKDSSADAGAKILGAGIGGAIGAAIAGPIGAAVGAGLGALIGTVSGSKS
jgi:hypothetical protein